MLALDGGLILLPMLRNMIRMIRPKLAWLMPADENIWFHRQVAYSMAFWAMVCLFGTLFSIVTKLGLF